VADGISVKVEREKVLKRFSALPADIRAKVRPAVVNGAEEIAALSRQFVPVSQHGSHGNPPGTLRDSIQTRDGDHDLAREVVAGSKAAFYARWVEFGTVEEQLTHPFFFVAFRAMKRRVRRRIANAVRRAIRG
jgi:HK97 gp10 family phage protein